LSAEPASIVDAREAADLIVQHVRRVRETHPQLRLARALLVLENNIHGPFVNEVCRQIDERAAKQPLGLRPYERLDVERALRGLRPAVTTDTDREGRTRLGSRTTGENKPQFFHLIRTFLEEGRLWFSRRFVPTGIVGHDEMVLGDFVRQLADDGVDVRRTFSLRSAVPMRESAALMEAYEESLRGRVVDLFEEELRSKRKKRVFKDRPDGLGRTEYWAIVDKNGRVSEKDDLVMALGQLLFNLHLVFTLPAFEQLRYHIM